MASIAIQLIGLAVAASASTGPSPPQLRSYAAASTGRRLSTQATCAIFHCRNGPGGACYDFSTAAYPDGSYWDTSVDALYTNDLQGFSAYCRSWGANADEFIGGEGACAAQGLQCTTAQSTDGRSFGCAPACPAPMFYP